MGQSEKQGIDRAKYLIGIVILAAALLLGATAYFGANSAKGTVAKLDNALGSAGAGNFSADMPSLNGSRGQPVPPAQGQPNGSAGAGAPEQPASGEQNGTLAAQQNAPLAAKKEVAIDFLYSDTCSHCQAMKPRVASVAAKLPADRFEVRYWNYADRGNAEVAAVYDDCSAKGYFKGSVPTFVANGQDFRVGEMQESEFLAWVCSKFSAPKPGGC